MIRSLLLCVLVSFCFTLPSFAGDVPKAGSCDVREMLGFCIEYLGDDWSQKVAKADCESPGGSYAPSSACPTENVIGICDYKLGDDPGRLIRYSFYGPDMTQKQAKMSCPGTFTAK